MFTPLALTPESPLARTLYEVWSGRPVTVVKAAPGSGKSTLITRLVSLLLMRTDLSVAILTPTRGAAFDLAERVGEALADELRPEGEVHVHLRGEPADRVQPGSLGPVRHADAGVPAA